MGSLCPGGVRRCASTAGMAWAKREDAAAASCEEVRAAFIELPPKAQLVFIKEPG